MEAQWNVEKQSESVIATATSIDSKIYLRVGCENSNPIVTLRLSDAVGFPTGVVEAQWDDGSTGTFDFLNENGTLRGKSKIFVEKLRKHTSVRLSIVKKEHKKVTDSISLTGSSRTIDSLPCSQPQLTDAEIRRILINRSIASYSGSCPCPYNLDRAGRRCGGRSAYSRPGGASPLCYARDVSDQAVRAYRARTKQ